MSANMDAVSAGEEAEVDLGVLERIARVAARQRDLDELLDRLIGVAKPGHTWDEIGDAMGITATGVRLRMQRRGWIASSSGSGRGRVRIARAEE